jgi:DNA polymerase-3 subunit chi
MFYHLERQPLEKVLPQLLERTLQRGWRAVVQAGSDERVEALDAHLWTYTEDSFLPHGTAKDGNAPLQPIFLTAEPDNPGNADVRFMVDGAAGDELAHRYVRVIYIFDGRDNAALAGARQQWKAAKAAGAAVTYWQQTDEGRWEKKA